MSKLKLLAAILTVVALVGCAATPTPALPGETPPAVETPPAAETPAETPPAAETPAETPTVAETPAETPPAMEVTPSVTVEDQAIADDDTVTIASVTAAQDGWLVVHADDDGAPGPDIGQAPVMAGENTDVVVEIDRAMATDTLHAMLHVDAGEIGVYEFPGADGPVVDDEGNVVNVPFSVMEAEETPEPGETPEPEETPVAELRTPQEAALEAAGGEEIGGTVSVLASWGGSEADTFRAMVAPFEEATGVTMEFTGTRDIAAVLTTRVQAGNPPDLAGLPGPGQMEQFARMGALVPLEDVLDMDRYTSEYAQAWIDLGTVDDQLVGIFIKAALNGLIWYSPPDWEEAGYEAPTTWDELIQLSQEIADTGTTPWSVALESAATSGWPGTNWIEDILLRQAGTDVYQQWYEGEIPWTSDEIRTAWETWGQIVADPNMVFGGANTMLTTPFGNVGDPLFNDPPQAYMAHQASFITDFFVTNFPDLVPGEDFDFFPFPPVAEGDPSRTIISGDLFGMFNDTPQSRALIRYLVTPEAQAIWAERGGAISPNRSVPVDVYPDEVIGRAAETLTAAEEAVFDGSDLMPEAMNFAFFDAVLEYVQNPDDLDSILENLDAVQADAYAQ